MIRRDITLLLIPHPSRAVRTLRLSYRAVAGLAGLAAVCIACIVFVTVGYVTGVVDQVRLERLERENRELLARVNTMQKDMDGVYDQMALLADLDRTIRLQADLDPIPRGARNLGMGGGGSIQEMGLTRDPLVSPAILEAEDTRSELERLMQDVLAQKESFQEILGSLERQAHLRRHTPSIRPSTGWISSGYGYRRDPFTHKVRWHGAVDISAPRGTPIVATADGIVSYVGRRGGLGRVVEIDHGYGFTTMYGHCSVIRVRKGESITRGQLIALMGSSGRSTGSHVHYEVRVSGTPVNPKNYFLPAGGTVN
jgi:murein DD-endopeptidase MepM/ murein hydrolase activator NlpD